jgi:hypothetical protein
MKDLRGAAKEILHTSYYVCRKARALAIKQNKEKVVRKIERLIR